jgi:hypothetical protein
MVSRAGGTSEAAYTELRDLVTFANNRQQIAETKLDLSTRKVALLEEQLAASKRATEEARAATAAEAAKASRCACCAHCTLGNLSFGSIEKYYVFCDLSVREKDWHSRARGAKAS